MLGTGDIFSLQNDKLIKLQGLFARLDRKYKTYYQTGGPTQYTEGITRRDTDTFLALWFDSFPVVWPNWENDFKIVETAKKNRHQKKKRVNKMLSDMFGSYDELHFVTFTFRDDVLSSTSFQSRHRYVQSFLNQYCRDYVANIDYGSKNQREHYHAVVAFKKDGVPNSKAWNYGFWSAKKVNMGNESSKGNMSRYIVKLQNHAGKLESGRLFRKRGMKEVDNLLPF